jgi:hypothetical protein
MTSPFFMYHTPLRYVPILICPFAFVKKKFPIHPPLPHHYHEPEKSTFTTFPLILTLPRMPICHPRYVLFFVSTFVHSTATPALFSSNPSGVSSAFCLSPSLIFVFCCLAYNLPPAYRLLFLNIVFPLLTILHQSS